MAELTDRPEVLAGRVATVRGLLAAGGGRAPEEVEQRVAASVTHLGLTARIVSPYLALAVLEGRLPVRLRLADLRWKPALGGPYPLSLPRLPARGPIGAAALADGLNRALCEGPVGELTDACERLGVSRQVLWGNAASAVSGAAGMVASARPDARARAAAFARLLLDRGPLRGAALPTPTGGFRRRSCCLIYRAAPGGSGALCGDCVLTRVPPRRT